MKTIQITKDYNLFKTILGNRAIYDAHRYKLREALKKDPETAEYNPIIVNENMEIIDGQHRFEALKELRLPIYYIQVPGIGLEKVQELNSIAKNWTNEDYAKSYVELGNNNYAIYLEFRHRYRFGFAITASFLQNKEYRGGWLSENFKNGKFKVNDIQLAHRLFSQLNDIGKYTDMYTLSRFAHAFRNVALNPIYDHERMLHKISFQASSMLKFQNATDHIRQLESIYNWKVSESERVRFY